jgi:hypothetical protein
MATTTTKSVCILYSFFNDDEQRANLVFFLRRGLRFDRERRKVCMHLLVTSPGALDAEVLQLLAAASASGATDVHVHHEVDCPTDASAWSRAVRRLRSAPPGQHRHDAYVFVNSTCRGPFLPAYLAADWVDLVRGKLGGDVRLVGPMLQVASDTDLPFVHTYMFAVDADGLDLLASAGVWKEYDKASAVRDFERRVTSTILDAGHNVESFLLAYAGVDWRLSRHHDHRMWTGDRGITCHEVPGNYFGTDVHPLEVMFIKNVRRASAVRGADRSGFARAEEVRLYSLWLTSSDPPGA